MNFDARIITVPQIDFNTLLTVLKQGLDYNPAEAVDNCGRKVSPSEKLISIISAFLDEKADPGLNPKLLGFSDVTIIVGLPTDEFVAFVNYMSGMEFAFRELRQVTAGFVKGSLAQWRDAIVAGTNSTDSLIQGCFCILHQRMGEVGLHLWRGYTASKTRDFYKLEYRPQ